MDKDHRSERDLHRLGHDLRNSLSAIYSYAQVLEASLAEINPKQKALATSICSAIKRMEEMISEHVDMQNKNSETNKK
jgi:signal transduction histidine kinase